MSLPLSLNGSPNQEDSIGQLLQINGTHPCKVIVQGRYRCNPTCSALANISSQCQLSYERTGRPDSFHDAIRISVALGWDARCYSG